MDEAGHRPVPDSLPPIYYPGGGTYGVQGPCPAGTGAYILCSYRYNEETNQFESENLQSLAEALADASPNTEANYEGRPDKLNEYAKRLIKLIDDCGTKQKARYIASLTRALLSKQIDTQKFFQLSRCIRNLTEEDLLFLSENIDQRNVS